MKHLLLIFLAVSCVAQDVVPNRRRNFQPVSGALTPQSLGNLMVYWINTNQLDKQIVTNWLDQVQSLPAKFDVAFAASNRPTNNISKGVYFDGFDFGQWLTNSALSCASNQTYFIRFTPNHFNSATVITIWGDTATGDNTVGTTSANKWITYGQGSPAQVSDALVSLNEYDIIVTISNAFLYAWTNGVVYKSNVAAGNAINAKQIPISLGALPVGAGNFYDGYIRGHGLYTNTAFNTTSASNLHRIFTNWFGGSP